MKKIFATITLLFLFALMTFDASAMSLQQRAHQNNAQFIQNQIISSMQSNIQRSYQSQNIKSHCDEEATTQINDSSTQETCTSEKSHNQDSHSHSTLLSEFSNALVYIVACIIFAVIVVFILFFITFAIIV